MVEIVEMKVVEEHNCRVLDDGVGLFKGVIR